jgi:D-xylose reductase
LEYVDPKVRYPPGWAYDGKDEIRFAKVSLEETYGGMELAVNQGLTKHIGVSNYTGALILDVLSYAKIPPSVLQIEHHPYLVQPQLYSLILGVNNRIELAKENGIAVTGYSSFGPQSFLELEWQKAFDTPLLFENKVIIAAAEVHGKTPAQVLLRWATQRGVAVIPKSNNPKRLAQNLDINSFDLTAKEIEDISALDRGLRFNNPSDYLKNPIRMFA